jgi:AAA+ ATPase superfamily predicted ATPase
MFIDREEEMAQLERLYRSKRAEFFVLYGRRRVGKTRLLRAFCANKPHIFFVATLSSETEQLATFSQALWRFSHTEVPEGFTFPSWESALRALAELPGRPIVVLDEFTYLISSNKAIPSILQKVWDERLLEANLMLVLCGSYIGIMEREVLGYQAPLYGRRTASHLLLPLKLQGAVQFYPQYTPVQKLEAWAVLGGMPYYLSAFTDSIDVLANVRAQILDPYGVLCNEPQLLLMEELRAPQNYFSILRAIAQGHTRLGEIANAAGVGDATTAVRYLDTLREMRVVMRSVPATQSCPEKSRKGIYQIADHFFRFWFRYVHPFYSSLDIGLADTILAQQVRPTWEQYVGYAFEEAAREYVARLAERGKLTLLPERIGSWWDREAEIDLLALNDAQGAMLAGECKWSTKPVGTDILDILKRKALSAQKEGDWPQISYMLFSRSGFTPALREVAEAEGVQLVGVEDMLGEEL